MNPRGLATLVALAAMLTAGCADSASPGATSLAPATPTLSSQPTPAPPPPSTVDCGFPGATGVSTADELRAALGQAQPGAVIHLRDGVYPGQFEITTAATGQQPITLCGSRAAVLDGGDIDSGYTLHLRNADHWRLSGFTIHGGQKGLMLDNTRGALIEGLLIHEVGDEALHLRAASSDNIVQGTTIRRTGLRKRKFGEGVYIGSAESNWCTHSNCEPDRSDRNIIQANDIADTTAEAIDVKEGTSGGTLRGNTLSGTAMTGADSWVDVKGNDWVIADNVGIDAPEDGFQTHEILDGWGERNVFHGNIATVNAPGYAINITKKERGNTVSCTNRATNAGAGLSNVACQ